MSEETTALDIQGQVTEIDVSKISPNPHQPRERFDETKLKELADSIRLHGLQQPVVVRTLNEDDGTYELIVGERRLRAFKLLDRETIPSIVRTATDEESRRLALIENLQRDDLTPMEEARSLRDLIEASESSAQAVASQLGRSSVYVLDRIALLNLPAEVQAMVDKGTINPHQAHEILDIEGAENQIKAAKMAAKMSLSANQIRGRFQRFMKKDAKGDNGKSSGGVVKFEHITASLVRAYEAMDPDTGFKFPTLRDANKRKTLRNQLELVRDAANAAIEQLTVPVEEVADLIGVASTDGAGPS